MVNIDKKVAWSSEHLKRIERISEAETIVDHVTHVNLQMDLVRPTANKKVPMKNSPPYLYGAHIEGVYYSLDKELDISRLDLRITREEVLRFEEEYFENPKNNSGDKLNSKTKNLYLRTIKYLSDLLVDGLTGKEHKDAERILISLDKKFGDNGHPIKSKTLAGYLKEANELD